MPRLPLEPMEKNLVFLPLLAIDGALIVSRLLQPARLRASAIGMKNLRSTASGFRAPSAASQPPTRRCTVSHALFGRKIQVTPRAHRAARARTCGCRHCEERSDEAIHSSFARQDGLLRCARNDGAGDGLLGGACHRARIRATRWLAMT